MRKTNQSITLATITKALTVMALLALSVGILHLPVAARTSPRTSKDEQASTKTSVITGKKGLFHFTKRVKVGDAVLKAGLYQVRPIQDSGEHMLVFKEVKMAAGYRMGNTPVGKEVARVKCRVEPITKKAGSTKMTVRTNAAGEREVVEVLVAGEAFKHIL